MDETVDNATLPAAPPLDAAGSVPSLDGGGMAEQFLAFVDAGGPVVVILLGCSVVALAIILMKFWQFYAARLGDRRRAPQAIALRSAERRVGKEWVRTCRSGWSPLH